MKKTKIIGCLAAMGTQLALLAGTFVTDSDALANRGVAASPRAREEFPGLTRPATSLQKGSATGADPSSMVAAALGGPRVREEQPQLDRVYRTESGGPVADTGVTARGLASNPRAMEENPALLRLPKADAAFQVAPLK